MPLTTVADLRIDGMADGDPNHLKVKKLRELSIIDAENTNIASAVCFSGLPCNTSFLTFSGN